MKDLRTHKKLSALILVFMLWMLPLTALAQTRIETPKNKYKVADDVKLGTQTSAEVEKKFPILNDAEATRYVERVGARLVNAIPVEYRQTSFVYRFKIVNASDINAFALPGGPMYVNRGMIEAARNEGEMAGVMAHEISHVALRHATAQATKQGSLTNQLGMLGMILGGAVLMGEAGAKLGEVGAALWMTKYSRGYETQADVLGSHIMADAGYDPRDLANMFKTIAGESKGGGVDWFSTHPDPGNRFENINREAGLLNVSQNPIKITREFERIQAKLRAMPKAKTMAEIEKSGAGQGNTASPGELPTDVSGYLNKTYGQWTYSTASNNCNAEFRQSKVSGDFNGDGKMDYAVKFTAGRSGYIVAFVSQGNAHRAFQLERSTLADMSEQGLAFARRGETFGEIVDDNMNRVNRRLQYDAPVGGICESSAYIYIFTGNGFRRAFTSD